MLIVKLMKVSEDETPRKAHSKSPFPFSRFCLISTLVFGVGLGNEFVRVSGEDENEDDGQDGKERDSGDTSVDKNAEGGGSTRTPGDSDDEAQVDFQLALGEREPSVDGSKNGLEAPEGEGTKHSTG